MSYQIRHANLGVYQGNMLGLGFWHPTSDQPELGFAEFPTDGEAKEHVAFLTGPECSAPLDSRDLTVEPFDRATSDALAELYRDRYKPAGDLACPPICCVCGLPILLGSPFIPKGKYPALEALGALVFLNVPCASHEEWPVHHTCRDGLHKGGGWQSIPAGRARDHLMALSAESLVTRKDSKEHE